MTPEPLLVLEGVGLTLPSTAGPVEILRSVDLTVQLGEIVAVTGPSGSGKSPLIAAAAGLEQPAGDRGRQGLLRRQRDPGTESRRH